MVTQRARLWALLVMVAACGWHSVCASAAQVPPPPEASSLKVAISFSPAPYVTDTYHVFVQQWGPTLKQLGEQAGVALHPVWSADPSYVYSGINVRRYPVVIGTPEVIARALRAGYTALAAVPNAGGGAVLVGATDSGVRSLNAGDAKRLRIAVVRPHFLANDLVRGMLKAQGLSLASFQHVDYYDSSAAVLVALYMGWDDVGGLSKTAFASLDKHYAVGGVSFKGMFTPILQTANALPGIGIAVAPSVSPQQASSIVQALESPRPGLAQLLASVDAAGMQPVQASSYQYVEGLLQEPPGKAVGSTVVDASQVLYALQNKRAVLVDVRPSQEYAAEHIAGFNHHRRVAGIAEVLGTGQTGQTSTGDGNAHGKPRISTQP